MSLFERARDKIKAPLSKSFGEETVRIMNFDDEDEENVSLENNESQLKSPKTHLESAFAIDDDETEFMKEQQKQHDSLMEEYKNITVPEIMNNKAQDVLDLYQIPATFELESEILLPEDLIDIDFDTQAPYGYDFGQVQAFVEQSKASIKTFVKLLRLRNEHVARLATLIDRLIVDVNNLKFDIETANGINIMPTQDNTQLENELMEARVYIKRLEEQIAKSNDNGELNDSEREKFDALQDELSVEQHRNAELKNEVEQLQLKLARIDEQTDHDNIENMNKNNSLPNYDSNDVSKVNYSEPDSAFAIVDDDDEFDAFIESHSTPQESIIEVMGSDGEKINHEGLLSFNDNDDPVDKLMEEWNK